VSVPVFGIAVVASFYALKGFFHKPDGNQEGATFLKYFTMTELIAKICTLIYAFTNAALYFNNVLNFSVKGLQGETKEKIIAGTMLGASIIALTPYTTLYFVQYYGMLSKYLHFKSEDGIFQRLASHKKLWIPLVVLPAAAFKALGQGSKSLTENLPESIVEAFDLSALPSWLPLVLALISAFACFITFFIFGSSASKEPTAVNSEKKSNSSFPPFIQAAPLPTEGVLCDGVRSIGNCASSFFARCGFGRDQSSQPLSSSLQSGYGT